VGAELELEATGATILNGFSIGAPFGRSLTLTQGSGTSYGGTVGSIDVLNFWVEE
jgi:hypothetical protein